MQKHQVILATRRQSGHLDSWHEHLCLKRVDQGYLLFTGTYEALAECSRFYNEETRGYELPDQIDGKPVGGIEYGYVVGVDLGACPEFCV